MRNLRITLAAGVLGLCAVGAVLAADAHVDAPQSAARPDERRATSLALRNQMASLRTLVEARSKVPLTAADYQMLGSAVRSKVENIIATCELAPATDAAFHPVLSELLAGAAMLAEPSERVHVAGTRRIFAALDDYGKRFRHPGWKFLQSDVK